MALGPTTYLVTLASAGATASAPETLQDVLNAAMPGGAGASDDWLKDTVFAVYATLNVTAWTGELPQSGTVRWPDGEAGAWTAEAYDSEGYGAVTQYIITHPASSNIVRVTMTVDAARGVVHNAVASIVGA